MTNFCELVVPNCVKLYISIIIIFNFQNMNLPDVKSSEVAKEE